MSLIVFAFIQFSMPLFSLLFNSWLAGQSPVTYFGEMLESMTVYQLVEFFCFFPLAAVAIYHMKNWTYPIYVAVATWTVLQNYLVWKLSYSGSLGVLAGSSIFHVACIAYYLHPKVRNVFFNDKVRWWDSAPRYIAHLDGVVINKDVREVGEILNLSVGGALVKTEWSPEQDEIVHLDFHLANFEIEIEGQVAHVGEGLFGVKFLDVTSEVVNRQFISKDLIRRTLQSENFAEINPPLKFKEHFAEWVGQLKQGHGLLPL